MTCGESLSTDGRVGILVAMVVRYLDDNFFTALKSMGVYTIVSQS